MTIALLGLVGLSPLPLARAVPEAAIDAKTGVTEGRIAAARIKDPSLHNWLALALAVRGEGISDFPICNKSFNLSYCGHDL